MYEISGVCAGLRPSALCCLYPRSTLSVCCCSPVRRVVEEALSTSGPFMASEVGELLIAITDRGGWDAVADYLEFECNRVAER